MSMRLRESRSLRLRDQLRVMLRGWCAMKKDERAADRNGVQMLTHASHFSCCDKKPQSESLSIAMLGSVYPQVW